MSKPQTGYIERIKKDGTRYLIKEVEIAYPIAMSNGTILHARKGSPFTLKNIYVHKQFEGVNNAMVSMRLYTRNNKEYILAGSQGFILDIDLTEEKKQKAREREELKPFLEEMKVIGFNITQTGGGYHFEGFFKSKLGKFNPLFKKIENIVREIAGKYLFDSSCDPYGSIRPPYSFDVERFEEILPYHDNFEALEPAEWYERLKKLNKQLTTKCIPKLFQERIPTKITKSGKVSTKKGSRIVSIKCPKYEGEILPKMERGIYKDAIPLELVFDTELLTGDSAAYSYVNKRNKILLDMIYRSFIEHYFDGYRNYTIISFLAYLRQQGLTNVNTYIKIFNYLEERGIKFTQNTLNSINYFFKKAMINTFIRYRYKGIQAFEKIGIYTYETKQHLIKQYKDIILKYYSYKNIKAKKISIIYFISNILNIKKSKDYITQLKELSSLNYTILSLNSFKYALRYRKKLRLESSYRALKVS